MKLPRLSRSDRALLGILLPTALLGSLVAWLAMPPEKEGGWTRQPSSFFNTGSGTKAAYLVLERLGYRVERLRYPINRSSLEAIDALVILEPIIEFEREERNAIERWVDAGNCLVLAPGVRFGRALPSAWFFDNWFDVEAAANPNVQRDRVRAWVGESLNANDPLMAGIRELVGRDEFRFVGSNPLKGPLAGSPVEEIWKDEAGLVALRVRYGEGTIIALADTYVLSNRGLDEADNATFLANLAREVTRGNPQAIIAFDELHHGYALREASWLTVAKLMLAEHWGWGVAQAALVVVLALYAGAVRFGRPRDVVQRPRRHHSEFAEAAGRTLHDAHANSLAYRTIYHHYRNRLCRLVHHPPEAESHSIAQAVAQQSGLNIARLLDEADQKLATGRVSRVELLDMAVQMHDIVEDLEHAA